MIEAIEDPILLQHRLVVIQVLNRILFCLSIVFVFQRNYFSIKAAIFSGILFSVPGLSSG